MAGIILGSSTLGLVLYCEPYLIHFEAVLLEPDLTCPNPPQTPECSYGVFPNTLTWVCRCLGHMGPSLPRKSVMVGRTCHTPMKGEEHWARCAHSAEIKAWQILGAYEG